MAAKWEKSCPAVAAMLREGLEDCLTAESFPEHHRRRLRSTNLLENMMKRLKKRTRVVGVFPNRASCDRLVGSQLLELHEEWQTEEKAYFNMEIRRGVTGAMCPAASHNSPTARYGTRPARQGSNDGGKEFTERYVALLFSSEVVGIRFLHGTKLS